jgi:serine/threonine protein phosphatase PrpC
VAGDWTGFVLLDGVSSAAEAHVGSSFMAQSFERLFNLHFPNGPTSDKLAWTDLRTSLSQHLVSMFVSKERQSGRDPDGDVDSLRVEALRRFGTTAEALFVRAEIGNGSQSDFVFARLAGDGSLFAISQDTISCLTSEDSLLNYPKGPVGALPAFDGEALILTGSIQPEAALVLVTDGIGDHIDTCELLREKLVSLSQDTTVSHQAIVQFLGFSCSEAGDDRTIALVRIK